MNVENAAYKVRLKKGLSKAYTLDKLRIVRDAGQVSDEDLCTSDGGKNFYRLGELLEYAEALASQSGHHSSPSGSSVSNSVYGFQPVYQPDESSLRSSIQSGSSIRRQLASDEKLRPDDSNYCGGPAAAEDALNSAIIRRRDVRETARRDSRTNNLILGTADTNDAPPSGWRSFFAGCAGGGLVTIVCAAAWFAVDAQNDPDLIMASLMQETDIAPLLDDSRFQTMNLDELTARHHVMNVQLRQLARQVSVNVDNLPTPTEIESLGTRKLALLPYLPIELSERERRHFDQLLNQYAELVRRKGPDGRNMDEQQIDEFTPKLLKLLSRPGAGGAERSSAVHDASEKCKLLYLLQLGRLQSTDFSTKQSARRTIQQAVESAFSRLYAELAVESLSFADVLSAAPAAEKPGLLLLRYWKCRAINREMADQWLTHSLDIVGEVEAEEVRASVAEVDNIEDQ